MPKKIMELMFNGKTGILLGEKPADNPDLDLSKFKFKTVEIDPTMEFYDGDHDNGTIMRVDEKPVVNESIVNSQTFSSIQEKYPMHKQINILMEMIDASDLPNTDRFAEMVQYIKDQRVAGKEKKKVYTESDAYHYQSEEDAKEKAKKAVDFD